MLDRNIIQGRGFRNTVADGQIIGFQFDLRNPNYRGTAASLLDGIDVTVDGDRIPDHLPVWTLQGRTFTLDELRASTGVRWQLDETATISVPKPGGLTTGVHQLDVTVYLRRPYFPPAVSRSAFHAAGTGVIVPAAPENGLRYGVSTYSYSGDMFTSMTLEDVFADIADLGATGIEILGEGNIPTIRSPPQSGSTHGTGWSTPTESLPPTSAPGWTPRCGVTAASPPPRGRPRSSRTSGWPLGSASPRSGRSSA